MFLQKEAMVRHYTMADLPDGASSLCQTLGQWVQFLIQPNPILPISRVIVVFHCFLVRVCPVIT